MFKIVEGVVACISEVIIGPVIVAPVIVPDAFKKVVDIPPLNVSNAMHMSGYAFLKYNALACANVRPPPPDDVPLVIVNTELSKIGNNSLGG
jgi:hypothetical protein